MSGGDTLGRIGLAAVFGSVVIGVALFFVVGPTTASFYAQENGLIESFSLIAYIMLLVMLVRMASLTRTDLLPLAGLLGFLLARELDLHLRLDWLGLVHGDEITLWPDFAAGPIDALTSATVMAIIGWLLWRVVSTHALDQLRLARRGEMSAVLIFVGLGLLVFAKLLDGGYRRLAVLGVDQSEVGRIFFLYLEEGLEVAAPCAFLVSALCRIVALQQNKDEGQPVTP